MKTIVQIILFLAGAVSLQAQQAADLRLNLEKNRVYRLKSYSEQGISQTINGVTQSTDVISRSVLSVKVLESAPDFVVAEVRFDTIINKTNSMGNQSEVNSSLAGKVESAEASEVMAYFMNRFCANALFAKIDYRGKVLEILNLKMFSGSVLQDTGKITGMAAPVLKNQITAMVGENALKSMIEAFLYNLPGQKTAAGDSWTIASSITGGGMSLMVSTKYALGGIEKNEAKVTAESNLQADENAKPMNYGSAIITYGDLKGIGKSSILLNTDTGLPVKNTSKTRISGNLNVQVQGNNLTMPMEMDIETTISLLQQ